MHVLPAKQSNVGLQRRCDYWTDRETDRQIDGWTPDKVISMCCYDLQVSQNPWSVAYKDKGSVPVDFLRPKSGVAHKKDDVISILMHVYAYTNMYIIKKIIFCRFILCWDLTSLSKPYEKSCRRRKVKIETRGPGALYRAQEYHCNLVLFFF